MQFEPTHMMSDGITPCGKIKIDHAGSHLCVESVDRERKRVRAWNKAHPDYWPEFYKVNIDYDRERGWRRRGIIDMTVEKYDELFKAQGGVCAICLTPPNGKNLDVDHNHAILDRFNVRGLLCTSCNRQLAGVDNGTREPTPEERAYLARAELALAS